MSDSKSLTGGLLGSVLQNNKATLVRAAELGVHAANTELAVKYREQERSVRHFFEAAWDKFSTDILAGRAVGDVELGNNTHRSAHSALNGYSWRIPKAGWQAKESVGIWNAGFPFHHIWLDFLAKCQSNGLVPMWHEAYDGGGRDNWLCLSVDVDTSVAPTPQALAETSGISGTAHPAAIELTSDLAVSLKLSLGAVDVCAKLSVTEAEALGADLLARAKQAKAAVVALRTAQAAK